MYQLSVDEAVSNGTPAVVVFATPAWCVSATCGPLLAQVKALRPEFDGVDFVHVEVYDDIQVSSFESSSWCHLWWSGVSWPNLGSS